jgi:hypothetical protein
MGFGSVFFPTGTYVVTRTARGTVAQGRYTPGATATLNCVADVQDVTGDHLNDLPEGVSSSNARMLYTTTLLLAESPANDADVVAIDGEDWKVVRVYTARVFANRYRALVVRIRP